MGTSIAAIAMGAALGALSRWVLGLQLNALLPNLPMGTLAANLIGGYLVGVAIAWLGNQPALPPEMRLFLVTGFLGGLTTFSTFSAEVVTQLAAGRFGWAFLAAAVHLLGSLVLTALGIATVRALQS